MFNLSCAAIGIMAIGSASMAYAAEKKEEVCTSQVIVLLPGTPSIEEGERKENTMIPAVKAVQTRKGAVQGDRAALSSDFLYELKWDSEEDYLLAKLAMTEAEECTLQCKSLVIMTVINRVESEQFPDSVKDVIFQYDEEKKLYQFSCIGDGRWDKVEPNQDCYEAVAVVRSSTYDYSGGALYFESCVEGDNWHSRSLEYLYQCDGLRFYK